MEAAVWRYIRCIRALWRVIWLYILCHTFYRIFPDRNEQRIRKLIASTGQPVTEEKVRCHMESQGSWGHLKFQLRFVHQMAFDVAFEGGNAPDVTLLSLSTREEKSILQFACGGRPLVVNFGSCS